jgi:hypothetical protein
MVDGGYSFYFIFVFPDRKCYFLPGKTLFSALENGFFCCEKQISSFLLCENFGLKFGSLE